MYKAHRDSRFEYAGDVIEFIETRQCGTCKFREPHGDDMMCSEVAMGLLLEEPLSGLDDVGNDGVVCRTHQVEPPPAEPADQARLF